MSIREFVVMGDGSSSGTKVFDENGLPVTGIRRITIEQDAGSIPMLVMEIVGVVKFASPTRQENQHDDENTRPG